MKRHFYLIPCLILSQSIFALENPSDITLEYIAELALQIQSTQPEPTESLQDSESSPSPSQEQTDPIPFVLEPLHRTILSAQISSPVKRIYKRMGESFQEGDILVKLDDVIYKANLQKTISALNRAKVALVAKTNLFKGQVASRFDIVDAQAAVSSAESDLSLARNQLDACTILAPYDGKVVAIMIEEHELPQVSQQLLEILDDDSLIAKIHVPTSYLPQLKIGQTLKVNIIETGETFEAKIIRIGSLLDPTSATIKVDAEINNENQLLRPGMTGTTHIL